MGNNSYKEILASSMKTLAACKADTAKGQDFVKGFFKKLHECHTPMLELRNFITSDVAKDDKALNECAASIGESIKNGGSNMVLNLAKEQHMKSLMESGATIPVQYMSMKDSFGASDSAIDLLVENGDFDFIHSPLMEHFKNDNNNPRIKPLHEAVSSSMKTVQNHHYYSYHPFAIGFQDTEKDRVLLLTESAPLVMGENGYTALDYNDLPKDAKKLYECLTVPFDRSGFHTLSEGWDFDLRLMTDGSMTLNGKNFDGSHTKDLLFESLEGYQRNPNAANNFNKEKFIKDADNFMLLLENFDELIICDTLRTVKPIYGNGVMLFEDAPQKPNIIFSRSESGEIAHNAEYESFSNLCESLAVGSEMRSIFADQLGTESKLVGEHNGRIHSLMESQKEINKHIADAENIKKLSEDGSAAMEKVNGQLKKLHEKLDENLLTLNNERNNLKLYK